MVADENHSEKEMEAYEKTPCAEGLDFKQGGSDEEDEAVVDKGDDEEDDDGNEENAARADLIVYLFTGHRARFVCALTIAHTADVQKKEDAQNMRNAKGQKRVAVAQTGIACKAQQTQQIAGEF